MKKADETPVPPVPPQVEPTETYDTHSQGKFKNYIIITFTL